MDVSEGRQVSIEYTLTLDDGEVVDSNVDGDPLTYTQGAGQILPALEKSLEGLQEGETTEVRLKATEGYGESRPELFQKIDASQVPEEAREVGSVLVGTDEAGNQRRVTVSAVEGDDVTLDLNHPLAGQALNFEVKVVSVNE